MLRKYLSILLLYSALAIILGHDFIGHHHHGLESEQSHHHSYGHHHNDDSTNEEAGFGHFFSNMQHDGDGLSFLSNHSSAFHFSKQSFQFVAAVHHPIFVFRQGNLELREYNTAYIPGYDSSHNSPPSGLRAPPVFIV